MFYLFLTVCALRDKIKFCSTDADCRPGYYCEPEVSLCNSPGMCLGDPCNSCKDCEGDLVCYNQVCSNPGEDLPEEPSSCGWPGHCLGDPCITYNDCDGELVCTVGKCSEQDVDIKEDDLPEETPEDSGCDDTEEPQEGIPISSGSSATLTYFTDNTFECIGQTTPPEFSIAVNPLLLGYTAEFYQNLNGQTPPWCGKTLTLNVKGSVFIGMIIDTCNPIDSGTFPDPITGEPIGGKCGYDNVIDLHGETGRTFLMNTVGDDFFQGDVDWIITA